MAVRRKTPQPSPPSSGAFTEAVLDRVVAQMDLGAMREALIDAVASRLSGTVRLDAITEAMAARHAERLGEALCERLVGKIANEASVDDEQVAGPGA